jgi:RNA polymerase-binding transcription factor
LPPSIVKEFGRALNEARAQLLKAVATTEAELHTIEEREIGAPLEDAGRVVLQGVLGRLDDREQAEFDEIEAGLERLRSGTFGLCEQCHGEIPMMGLRALPSARRCLACQSIREKARAGG